MQVVRNPHELDGKLMHGGLWWACARCLVPVYYVGQMDDTNGDGDESGENHSD